LILVHSRWGSTPGGAGRTGGTCQPTVALVMPSNLSLPGQTHDRREASRQTPGSDLQRSLLGPLCLEAQTGLILADGRPLPREPQICRFQVCHLLLNVGLHVPPGHSRRHRQTTGQSRLPTVQLLSSRSLWDIYDSHDRGCLQTDIRCQSSQP
jgi:hypothetical protein